MQDNNIFTLIVEDNSDNNIKHYVSLYEVPLGLICEGEDTVLKTFKEIIHAYLQTEAGQEELKFNSGAYTWNDFLNIPNNFLEPYGIREIRICSESVATVIADESLTDPNEIIHMGQERKNTMQVLIPIASANNNSTMLDPKTELMTLFDDEPCGLEHVAQKPTLEKLYETIKELDWKIYKNIEDDETVLELGKYSPAGEEFIAVIRFDGTGDDLIDKITECANDFDTDEHAEMWIEARKMVSGVPQSIKALINDAEAIKEMLNELSEKLRLPVLKQYFNFE